MKYLVIALCLLGLCGSLVNAEFFKFEECPKVNGTLADIRELDVTPDPVLLKRNNVTVNVDATLNMDILENAILKVRYYKIKSVLGIKLEVRVPCLLGKFGSCTLPVCKYMNIFKEQVEPLFAAANREYGCPIKAGPFVIKDTDVKIPELGAIARLIVYGRYKAEFDVVVDGKVVACYKAWLEAK